MWAISPLHGSNEIVCPLDRLEVYSEVSEWGDALSHLQFLHQRKIQERVHSRSWLTRKMECMEHKVVGDITEWAWSCCRHHCQRIRTCGSQVKEVIHAIHTCNSKEAKKPINYSISIWNTEAEAYDLELAEGQSGAVDVSVKLLREACNLITDFFFGLSKTKIDGHLP